MRDELKKLTRLAHPDRWPGNALAHEVCAELTRLRDERMSVLEAARVYLKRGWVPVPLQSRSKKPIPDAWCFRGCKPRRPAYSKGYRGAAQSCA